MKIGVDIDGTIAAWPELIAKLVNYNNPGISEIEVWRYFERREPEFVGEIIDELAKNFDVYRLLKPYESCVEVLRNLDQRGIEMYYISSRPRLLYTITQRWLLNNNFPRWSNVYLGCDDKLVVADMLGLTYFIEDWPPPSIDALSTKCKVLVPKRVWNHTSGIPQFKLRDSVFIFSHWSQVYQYLKSEGAWKENGKNSRQVLVVTPS